MDEALLKRTMPHSEAAEKSVIGAMLLDKDAITAAGEVLKSEDFYSKAYGALFEAIVELNDESKNVDVVTLNDKIKQKDVPAEYAAADFLKNIITSVPTSANIKNHVEIVKEKSTLRRLIKLTEDIGNTCYLGKEPVEEILDETEQKVFKLLQTNGGSELEPIGNIVMNALKRIELASKTAGGVTGISTGFTDLDSKLAGLQNSDLVLVAARPSMGKTAFVLNLAQNICIRDNKTALIFSLEMPKEQLVTRLFAQESRVDAQNIRTGNLSDNEWENIIEATNAIASSKLLIDDTSGISISELRSKCRKYKLEHNIDLIIIDYLQLMSGSKNTESRQQEISEISRALKGIARELDVPVIALSQLSRAVEQRQDHRPMLSDLRESGAIEQDADVVMFLYRDEYYHPDSQDKGITEVIIAKQRNGPIGTVKLLWLSEFTRFVNFQYQNKE